VYSKCIRCFYRIPLPKLVNYQITFQSVKSSRSAVIFFIPTKCAIRLGNNPDTRLSCATSFFRRSENSQPAICRPHQPLTRSPLTPVAESDRQPRCPHTGPCSPSKRVYCQSCSTWIRPETTRATHHEQIRQWFTHHQIYVHPQSSSNVQTVLDGRH